MSEPTTPLAGAAGSALVSLPTHLKEEIQKLLHAAWRDGFDAEHDGREDFFDGFAIADDLLNEPRRVCCECLSRLCDGEEDEMCRECWDASIARANATREERIAAGWVVDPDGGLMPPTRKCNRGITLDDGWEVSSGLHQPNTAGSCTPEAKP